MTTALMALQKGEIQLSEIEQLILEEAATDDAAFDPIPTKITIAPGGINVFSTSDGDTMKSLTAIIAISQKARAYWPEKGTGQPPLCASYDGSMGIFNPNPSDVQMRAALTARQPHPAILAMDEGRPVPTQVACVSCPLNAWGSVHQGGAQGKSKACKELRRLVILLDGWTQPALLTLPPTSLRNFDAYASGLSQKRNAYWAVRTKITLEAQKSNSGDPYSIATFAMDSRLADSAQVRAVIALRDEYKALVRQMEIVGDEYDTTPVNGEEDSLPF